VVLVLADEHDHLVWGRSSSAAKKADAAFKISLARRNSATSRFSRLISACSADVVPGRSPALNRPGESGDSVCWLTGLGEADVLTVVGGLEFGGWNVAAGFE
jgi:hypothetical protein